MIQVEVAYATPQRQVVIPLEVAEGSTVAQVIEYSGIVQQFPELDAMTMSVGIFSKPVKPDHLVQFGDRIEIYRPLLIDPKQKRRAKAQKR
jgi:putative ubiquitin-RnfH superfamily antitoxin RatB of RatAB toxin-antitoxin module